MARNSAATNVKHQTVQEPQRPMPLHECATGRMYAAEQAYLGGGNGLSGLGRLGGEPPGRWRD